VYPFCSPQRLAYRQPEGGAIFAGFAKMVTAFDCPV